MRTLTTAALAALLLACAACPAERAPEGPGPTAAAAPPPKPTTGVPVPAPGRRETPLTGPAPRSNVLRYHMKGQKLTDAQLVAWVAGQEARGLFSLDLRDNKVTHVGVEALGKARTSPARSKTGTRRRG